MAGRTVGRTDLSTRPRVARPRLAAATVEAIGTGLRRAQVNRVAQFLREVATEADRPIVRHSICGSPSCNRVLRADTLAALARHQVTVAEAEAATLHRATAAVVDTQRHPAAEAITARLVTVAGVAPTAHPVVVTVAATAHPVVVTVAATAHPAAMVAAIAAVGVADTLLEAEAAALLPAAVVIPLEEITAAITKKSYG
jgi:hypothetical protein